VEEVLRALYRLQQIDLELDELDDGGGDLPAEVESLQTRVNQVSSMVEGEETRLHELRRNRGTSSATITEIRDRIRMLNERLRTVRNNKEYEATTNEIAAAEEELVNVERSMSSFDTDEAGIMREIEMLGRQRDEINNELEEKSGTLRSLRETHSDEIASLRAQKEGAAKLVNDDLLKRYEHIRTAYNDAVVKLRKGACSGCYRAITPQTIIEMRRNDQLFFCEHCGRILVDEEIAASVLTSS
jgi:predicted  nucleic acid-binding Zn-ribbon protein